MAMTETETETDPRRVRLAEIDAELREIDEHERAAQAQIPDFDIANVGNGEVAARIQRSKGVMYECDSRRSILKATRKNILAALDQTVTREARVREHEILSAIREHLSAAMPQLEEILSDVRACRVHSNAPTWRSKLTPADVARAAASGSSLVDPSPEDLDRSVTGFSIQRRPTVEGR